MIQYSEFVFELTLNIALFITGAFLFGNIYPKIVKRSRFWRALLLGGILGALGIIIYFLPLYLGVDNLIPSQMILVAVALLYGGRAAGLVTYLMACVNLVLLDAPNLLIEIASLTIPFLLIEAFLILKAKSRIRVIHQVSVSVLLAALHFVKLMIAQSLMVGGVLAWILILSECVGIAMMSMMAFSFFEHELSRDYVEKKLNDSVERYQVLVDNSPDIIFNCNASGEVLMANRKFYQVLAAGKSERDHFLIYEVLSGERDQMEMRRIIADALKKEKPIFREREIQIRVGKTKVFNIVAVPFFNAELSPSGVTITWNDVTDLREQERTIRKIAYFDDLTGLPNRASVINKLDQALYYSRQRELRTAIVFIDIDNFKNYNDTFGHFFGDEILIEASRRFSDCLRKYDVVGRLGGDEFIIIIRDVQQKNEVVEVIHRLEHSLEEPMKIKERLLYLSISSGIAFFPDDGDSVEDLLRNADTAMYRAKELGRNNYQFYDKSMKDQVVHRMELEKRLREAMVKKELALYYQPQYYLDNRSLRGNEVLLRWINDDVGMISTSEFIPVAEETGMIHAMGEWILVEACKQNVKWCEQFGRDLFVSVNISPVQLKQKNFVEIVNRALGISGMNPELLELEITENILIESKTYVLNLLQGLRKIGIKIALDDFGTGYSSLNYLKELEFDTLKIDKSFIDQIDEGGKESSILNTIIDLVQNLGLELIAEGVETYEQMHYLEDRGCDIVQGYLFGKPLSKKGLKRMLDRLHLSDPLEKEKTGSE